MKVPLSWLRELVPVDLPVADLAHRLTMAGTESEGFHRVGQEWSRVFVGRVLDLEKHPSADSLSIAKVQGPDGEVTIVTAATNLFVGARVPLILAGGTLGGETRIERRVFRGVTSDGMVCSGDELGLSPDRTGIYILEDEAPVGIPLADYLDDTVLDLYITPNRPDCLSVYGIAREVAALTGASLAPLSPTRPPVQHQEPPYPLELRDPDICPRYTLAMVSGLTVAPSPPWLQRRLHLSGVRPITNVVDVTNYVMLEVGQPLHAFDRDKVEGGIIVRRARRGERMATIDGVDRELTPDMLVIADHQKPIGVAGVMGGLSSEVADETTRLALESATFDQRNIRRTARDLRLGTEASRRFERGMDPALAPLASNRAVELLAELAGGYPVGPIQDIYPNPETPRRIEMPAHHVSEVMGREYRQSEIDEALTSLGFEVARRDDIVDVTVPSYRRDIEGKHDLVEEVARITGYDSIPETLPYGRLPAPRLEPSRRVQQRLKTSLVAAELQETLTYSLVDPVSFFQIDNQASWPADPVQSPLIRVWNPMASDRSALRQSLLPSMLQTVWENLRHQDRVSLFEIAKVYLPSGETLPDEQLRLVLAMSGRRQERGWNTPDASVDFFDLKGVVEAIGTALHVSFNYRASEHRSFHPARCAAVLVTTETGAEQRVGFIGQVHPTVADRFDLGREVFAGELDVELLIGCAADQPRVRPLPRFPGVELDLAVLVDESASHERVQAEIVRGGGELLERALLFDVYRGAPIPEGRKSLAYALTFRAEDRTLTDDEAVEARSRIEARLTAALGAQIRGR